MREVLRQRCVLFLENRDIIRGAFTWESAYIYPLCAGIYAAQGVRADAGRMRTCLNLLKQRTGAFSNFRGSARLATAATLALCSDPDQQLTEILAVYDALKTQFWGSEFLVAAAAVTVRMAQPQQYAQIVQKTRAIYERMKESHPFLTSGEDSAFAALLALSGLNDAQIGQETERCYEILKPFFWNGNAVQSLSHILALGAASAEQKCQRAIDLFNHLKAHGYRYGTGYELATLGALALLDTDMTALAADMMAVDDYLKRQSGFGPFGVGARQRLMYAGLLTMCDYLPNAETMQVAILSGVVAQIIAQQVAILTCIAATSAASGATN